MTTAPAATTGGRGRSATGPAHAPRTRLSAFPCRHQIQQPMPVPLERLPGHEPDRRAEERAVVHEGVVLAALARDVRAGQARELVDQPAIELAPQPFHAPEFEVDADDPGAVPAIQELLDQRLGRLAPERLDVLEPAGAQPLVVPRPDVLEV